MKPFNAEIPLGLAADAFYTPNDLFYVRNHLGTPNFENEEDFMSHRLSEHGNVSELDIMKTCDICNKEFANLKLHKTMKHMQVRVHTIVEFSDYLIKV